MSITNYERWENKEEKIWPKEQETLPPEKIPYPYKYYLYVWDNMTLEVMTRPNWWIRMWCKILLGWKWKKIQ